MTEDSHTAKKGDYLLIDYTGRFEDGTVFDTTLKEKAIESGIYDKEKKYTPLFFRADTGQVVKGIDREVLGMKEGEEKILKILPEDAYGEYKKYLVQDISLSRLELQVSISVLWIRTCRCRTRFRRSNAVYPGIRLRGESVS